MIWPWLSLCAASGLLLTLAPAAQARHVPQPWPDSRVILVSDDSAAAQTAPPSVGPVTGRPLPRFASLKSDEGNARHGPSLEEPIKWVFVREDMPLLITDEAGAWRRVEDRDGQGGWVHFALLSGTRTVIVTVDRFPLRSQAADDAPEVALLEADVIARVETCTLAWCEIAADGYIGWAPKSVLWGVSADEVIE